MREQILALGRRMQSGQTGFIHLNYLDPLGKRQDTIPVVENFLFALALLKSRSSEQMLEARELLHKLFPFQSTEGNFPIYLHEYPKCKELFAAAKILPALYWILKDFGSVLGTEVKECSRRLLAYCREHRAEAPAHLAILMAGPEELEEYRQEKYWYSPTLLGSLIIALQMNPTVEWPEFWIHLKETWQPKTLSYAGPHFYDARYEHSPFSHLYQTFMRGSVTDHPYSLYAALLQPKELQEVAHPIFKSGVIDSSPFEFTHTEEAASYFAPGSSSAPYQLIWVDGAKSHTLRLSSASPLEKNGGSYRLKLQPEQVDQFSLELDTGESTSLFINGERQTVFQMGASLEIATGTKHLRLSIAKEGGEGNVLGHVSMAPATEGYSRKWVFSLRSVAVAMPLQISLTIC